jgi:sarcosine oxidase subunit delta
MLLLDCPNCGARNVSEFRYGGEVNARPKDPAAADEHAWNDFLFMRNNVSGLQTEWWLHRNGCGLWFLAERDTLTNVVARTFEWTAARAAPAPAGGDDDGRGAMPAGEQP